MDNEDIGPCSFCLGCLGLIIIGRSPPVVFFDHSCNDLLSKKGHSWFQDRGKRFFKGHVKSLVFYSITVKFLTTVIN